MSRVSLRIGLVGKENAPWEYVQKACAKRGIELVLKLYEDYFSPNEALNEGSLELNSYQHRAFLQHEMLTKGYKFKVLGTTYFDPIGLYSANISSLAELKEHARIAYPEDPSNALRSLQVLQQAGLIELHGERISSNPLELQFVKSRADLMVSLLPSVTAAFINGNYAYAAGLNPVTDPIWREQFSVFKDDNPYVKVIVCREDSGSEHLRAAEEVTALYRSNEVASILKTMQGGSLIPTF